MVKEEIIWKDKKVWNILLIAAFVLLIILSIGLFIYALFTSPTLFRIITSFVMVIPALIIIIPEALRKTLCVTKEGIRTSDVEFETQTPLDGSKKFFAWENIDKIEIDFKDVITALKENKIGMVGPVYTQVIIHSKGEKYLCLVYRAREFISFMKKFKKSIISVKNEKLEKEINSILKKTPSTWIPKKITKKHIINASYFLLPIVAAFLLPRVFRAENSFTESIGSLLFVLILYVVVFGLFVLIHNFILHKIVHRKSLYYLLATTLFAILITAYISAAVYIDKNFTPQNELVEPIEHSSWTINQYEGVHDETWKPVQNTLHANEVHYYPFVTDSKRIFNAIVYSDYELEIFTVPSEQDYINFDLDRDEVNEYPGCDALGQWKFKFKCTVRGGGIVVYNPTDFRNNYHIIFVTSNEYRKW